MAGVASAAGRMGVLIDDLLLLARLDSGRPLADQRVDLSRLLVESVADAHAAGPGHRWQLTLPDEPVEVTGDELRLHQVLDNLLANARTHTPAGTVVTVSLARIGPDAVLTVADDGPGIPEHLQPPRGPGRSGPGSAGAAVHAPAGRRTPGAAPAGPSGRRGVRAG